MEVNPTIAVDLGGTNVRVAAVSDEGKIIKKISEPTAKKGQSGNVITKQIIRLVETLETNLEIEKIDGIGISSIGPLDYKKGIVDNAPNVPFKSIPLVHPLESFFNCKVILNNDANAAVLAEKMFGDGSGLENIVYITISTGIGAGAIVNGALLMGKSGNAGEVGHLIVDTRYNFECSCQRGHGHWEGTASGRNLPRFYNFWLEKEKGIKGSLISTSEELFKSVSRGDENALEFLDEIARINARAISDIIVACDPELISLGGSVALNNETLILDGIKKYVDSYLKTPEIRVTKLGGDIAILGAAAPLIQEHRQKIYLQKIA